MDNHPTADDAVQPVQRQLGEVGEVNGDDHRINHFENTPPRGNADAIGLQSLISDDMPVEPANL